MLKALGGEWRHLDLMCKASQVLTFTCNLNTFFSRDHFVNIRHQEVKITLEIDEYLMFSHEGSFILFLCVMVN